MWLQLLRLSRERLPGAEACGGQGCSPRTRALLRSQPACHARRQRGKCSLTPISLRLWMGKKRFLVLGGVCAELCSAIIGVRIPEALAVCADVRG